MKRRAPLKRKALQRKARTRARVHPDDTLARRFWHAAVVRGGCVMCKAVPLTGEERQTRGRVQAHHIIAKRHLKEDGHRDRLWDVRNGLGLCELHHTRHERKHQPVPYELIPDAAMEFASELGLEWRIEREYRRCA